VGPFGEGSGFGSDADPVDASADLNFSGATPAFSSAQVVYTVDLPGSGEPGAVKFTAPATQDYTVATDETVNLELRDSSGNPVLPLFNQDISATCQDVGAQLPEAPVGTEMGNASVYSLSGGGTYTVVFLSGSSDQFHLTIDEPNDFMNAYYPDSDADGYGVLGGAPLLSECAAPVTHAESAGDCDDGDGRVGSPGAFDVPDDPMVLECTFDLELPIAGPRGCTGSVEVTGLVTSVDPPLVIPASASATEAIVLPPGTHTIEWTATDSQGARVETQTVTVTDVTPPVFDAESLDAELHMVCDFALTHIDLEVPTATDNCEDVIPTGTVTESSNPNLTLPLALNEDGEADLPLGTHTITWTAEDSSMNSATLMQTVVIRPAVQATDSVSVRNEQSTINGAVANSGDGGVSLENATITGDVESASVVEIGYRANVGDVLSAIDIVWDDTVAEADHPIIASETIAPVGFAPALDLSSVSFPTMGGQFWVNANESLPLSPGAYGNYTLNSGATVTLGAGVYFFEQLAVNHAATLVVTDDTVIFVKAIDRFQGDVVAPGGGEVSPVIGFSGTSFNLEADFSGIIIAPNATVRMGTANAMTFSGMVHAKNIDVANQAVLTCEVLSCDLEVCGGNSASVPDPTCEDGVQNGGEAGVDCGGPCTTSCAPVCNPGSYEAETMFHSTGGPTPGGWNIYGNGFISTPHAFSAGQATVTVTVRGAPAYGVWPHMTVSVGSTQIANLYVPHYNWQSYSFPYNASGGTETVRVTYDNDVYAPPQDRNLYVDKVTISCP
jgi:hypothetical protein